MAVIGYYQWLILKKRSNAGRGWRRRENGRRGGVRRSAWRLNAACACNIGAQAKARKLQSRLCRNTVAGAAKAINEALFETLKIYPAISMTAGCLY